MRLFALLLILTTATTSLPAQSSPSLVGSWRLISTGRVDSAGRFVPTWDDHPDGRIMYTADGQMSAQLYDTRRPKLGVDWNAAEPESARRAFVGLVTYFGRYSVDTAARTVTHDVEGAMSPDWIGSKLVRAYRFIPPNRIELRVLTTSSGGRGTNGTVLVWERVGR